MSKCSFKLCIKKDRQLEFHSVFFFFFKLWAVALRWFLGWTLFTISCFFFFVHDSSLNESNGGRAGQVSLMQALFFFFFGQTFHFSSFYVMNTLHFVEITESPRMRDTNNKTPQNFWRLEIPNLESLKPNPNMPLWQHLTLSHTAALLSLSLEESRIESICKVKEALLNNPFHTRWCLV